MSSYLLDITLLPCEIIHTLNQRLLSTANIRHRKSSGRCCKCPLNPFCKRESYLELKIRLMGGGTSCDRLRVPMDEFRRYCVCLEKHTIQLDLMVRVVASDPT